MKGKRMIAAPLLIFSCLAGCQKEGPDESAETVTGVWQTTAYFTSDGYYIPVKDIETFTFRTDGSFIFENSGTVDDITVGEYTFKPELDIIICKESKGWDMTIHVEFEGKDKAVFNIMGKVLPKKVKVERKSNML